MTIGDNFLLRSQEIQVDFEGRNPVDSDFHGIRQLLQQLLLKAPVNLSELSDEIIGQNYIGSVVTQCEDDAAGAAPSAAEDKDAADDDDDDDAMDEANTVFGITTAINMTQKADLGCVQALRQHLLARAERHSSGDTLKTVRSVLTGTAKSVGFLLNERFVNIPPQISVPLLENLATEVAKAAAKGMPYKFDYYVMLVKLYRAQPTKKSSAVDEFYTNAEEEVFVEHALCSFEYSVKGETLDDEEDDGGLAAAAATDDGGLVPWRKLVVFDASKLPVLIEAIKKLIGA